MVELNEDGSVPGPDTHGQIYKVIDQITGKVGYNYTAADSPVMKTSSIKMIEGYSSFGGWMTNVMPIAEVEREVVRLNRSNEFVDTEHTKLVKRVEHRLRTNNSAMIDGHSALDDMLEMFHDIQGRRQRPPLPGWPRSDGRDGFNGSVIIEKIGP